MFSTILALPVVARVVIAFTALVLLLHIARSTTNYDVPTSYWKISGHSEGSKDIRNSTERLEDINNSTLGVCPQWFRRLLVPVI